MRPHCCGAACACLGWSDSGRGDARHGLDVSDGQARPGRRGERMDAGDRDAHHAPESVQSIGAAGREAHPGASRSGPARVRRVACHPSVPTSPNWPDSRLPGCAGPIWRIAHRTTRGRRAVRRTHLYTVIHEAWRVATLSVTGSEDGEIKHDCPALRETETRSCSASAS
jgi:hypothetical protein